MDYGISDFLSLFGALGLFLYGMKVMSDALMRLAGERMRNILATTTSNSLYAVFTGFLITALIQSSSATTLMVVSFANASLLTLTESIGVIMGANIGTTVTAWLISILGFKVNMSSIAIPVVGIGFILSLSEQDRTRTWGKFLIGFALLFIGLQFLKDAMPDIKSNPEIMTFLTQYGNLGFTSVLLFLLAGTLLTLILQSSSATMALTILMCYQGWIPFELAAAMVLGENIGTTITANMAAFVANYHAKRTARAHFIFNIIGVSWMLAVFPIFISAIGLLVERLEGSSPFIEITAIPVALALFHSCFNILNTTLLILLIPFIAKIVTRMVPDEQPRKQSINQPIYLTKASLKFPQTGMKALVDESLRLFSESAYKVIAHGVNVHRSTLESGQKLKKTALTPELIRIDIERIYYEKVKGIYSEILAYATKLQSRFSLEQDKLTSIRNILLANRIVVEVIKDMKPLHHNMSRFITCENQQMCKEYNRLRLIIMKTLREIHKASQSHAPLTHLHKLKKLKRKAQKLDLLLNDSINTLLQKNTIEKTMASSLLNDGANASKICQKLVDVAILLFTQRDSILDELNINEQAKQSVYQPVDKHKALTVFVRPTHHLNS